jgi:FixJ family two-component response regulator
MSTAPDPFNDCVSFRAGQQHMARRIAQLIRDRRYLLRQLAATTATKAIASELEVLIRAVDAMGTSIDDGDA